MVWEELVVNIAHGPHLERDSCRRGWCAFVGSRGCCPEMVVGEFFLSRGPSGVFRHREIDSVRGLWVALLIPTCYVGEDIRCVGILFFSTMARRLCAVPVRKCWLGTCHGVGWSDVGNNISQRVCVARERDVGQNALATVSMVHYRMIRVNYPGCLALLHVWAYRPRIRSASPRKRLRGSYMVWSELLVNIPHKTCTNLIDILRIMLYLISKLC